MFLRQASDAQMQEGIPHNVGMFLGLELRQFLKERIPHNVGMFLS